MFYAKEIFKYLPSFVIPTTDKRSANDVRFVNIRQHIGHFKSNAGLMNLQLVEKYFFYFIKYDFIFISIGSSEVFYEKSEFGSI